MPVRLMINLSAVIEEILLMSRLGVISTKRKLMVENSVSTLTTQITRYEFTLPF